MTCETEKQTNHHRLDTFHLPPAASQHSNTILDKLLDAVLDALLDTILNTLLDTLFETLLDRLSDTLLI